MRSRKEQTEVPELHPLDEYSLEVIRERAVSFGRNCETTKAYTALRKGLLDYAAARAKYPDGPLSEEQDSAFEREVTRIREQIKTARKRVRKYLHDAEIAFADRLTLEAERTGSEDALLEAGNHLPVDEEACVTPTEKRAFARYRRVSSELARSRRNGPDSAGAKRDGPLTAAGLRIAEPDLAEHGLPVEPDGPLLDREAHVGARKGCTRRLNLDRLGRKVCRRTYVPRSLRGHEEKYASAAWCLIEAEARSRDGIAGPPVEGLRAHALKLVGRDGIESIAECRARYGDDETLLRLHRAVGLHELQRDVDSGAAFRDQLVIARRLQRTYRNDPIRRAKLERVVTRLSGSWRAANRRRRVARSGQPRRNVARAARRRAARSRAPTSNSDDGPSDPPSRPIDLVSVAAASRAREPELSKKRPYAVRVTRESLDAARAGGVSA